MAKSKDLIKKHSESVTHNTLGNLITAALLYGGAGVIGLLTTHSALLSALPLYAVLLLGAVVFLIIALGFYLLAVARDKTRALQDKPQAVTQDEASTALIESEAEKNIKTLNDQIASLKHQHSEEIWGRIRAFDDLQRRHDVLKERLDDWERYAWLVSIADIQANDISDYLVVEKVYFCYHKLTDTVPLIVFGVDIYNKSVFDITIEHAMQGHLEIGGVPLLRDKRRIDGLRRISPISKASLTLEQRLSPEEAALIAECDEHQFGSFFHFNKLIIMIGDGTQFPQFERKSLELPQFIGSNDAIHESKVAALQTKVDALQAKLDELSADKPNLVYMYHSINAFHIDARGVIEVGGDATGAITAIVAKFQNKAEPPQRVSAAKGVIAHITYFETNGQPYAYSIDKGAWATEEYNQINFEVGDTRRLIIAAEMPIGGNVLGYQNGNDSPERHRNLSVIPLDRDQFIVEVELVVRGNTEAGRKFRFKLTLRPYRSLELIEP